MENIYGNEQRERERKGESDVILQCGCGGIRGVRVLGFRWMKRRNME